MSRHGASCARPPAAIEEGADDIVFGRIQAMRRRAFALSASLLLAGLMPGLALAASPVLDQSNAWTPGYTFSGAVQVAQTFTAGKTGALTSVDLYMAGSGSVAVSLEAATNGLLTLRGADRRGPGDRNQGAVFERGLAEVLVCLASPGHVR